MRAPDPTVRVVAGVCVVELVDDVDLAVTDHLEQAIVRRIDATATLVVDLTAVTFLDSSGVRLMDRLVGRHRQAGGDVLIVAPLGGAPRFSLGMCAFPPHLLADTVEEALARRPR